jgi:DNA polymerase V
MDFVEGKENASSYELPLFFNAVSAGFPSPADDFIEARIDLNKQLVKHPTATFLVRVVGDSMINAGIRADDILIVDRSIEPRSGQIVVAAINGELTVKRYHKTDEGVFLLPENENYQPISLSEYSDNIIWGVVTNMIHKFV